MTLPEIVMAVSAVVLSLLSAFGGDRSARVALLVSIIAYLGAGALIALNPVTGEALNNMFIADGFGRFAKLLTLGASAICAILAWPQMKDSKIARPEYAVLMVLATLGMMLMISATDLTALYLGLELQSLPLYVLASFKRESTRSSEAGLKYVILGALSSGVMLYGISLVYGFSGATSFSGIAAALSAETISGMTLGLVFVVAGLGFKIAAVPFHMWAPDVYEGAPLSVTAFIASAPKVAAFALLARLAQPVAALAVDMQPIIAILAAASMIWGSVAGLVQTNIKRLLAYSSIANAGAALTGLAAMGADGVHAILVFMAIYIVGVMGVFGVMLALRRNGESVEAIADLAGLARSRPVLAAAMASFMFSLAGIPPLAGFFGKYLIFLAAIKAGLLPLALVGVLASVVAAAYYLRIVKIMYFENAGRALDAVSALSPRVVAVAAAMALVLFIAVPSRVISVAKAAAETLFVA